jgi:uncharacterized protein
MMTSLITALLGGALIGLSASALLFFSGRIAGVSGILGGALSDPSEDRGWRVIFLIGLLMGGLIVSIFFENAIQAPTGRSSLMLSLAGLLVGIGTRLGNGCTSGHGICGLTRFSSRSIVATFNFMLAGVITATIIDLSMGGVS